MTKSKIALAVALFALAGAASAAELVVTSQNAKGASAVGLDFVSDGNATAFQARLAIAGAEEKNTDVSKCLSGLPKSHQGSCKVTKSGEVTIIVFSGTNAPLPNGLVSIGQIGLRNTAGAKAGSKIQVTELLVSDPSSNAVQAKSTVD